METTLTAWRRRVQQIEVKAANKVDEAFPKQVFTADELKKSDLILVRLITGEIKEAMNEGVKFGKFIKRYSRKIAGKSIDTDKGNGGGAQEIRGSNQDQNDEAESERDE